MSVHSFTGITIIVIICLGLINFLFFQLLLFSFNISCIVIFYGGGGGGGGGGCKKYWSASVRNTTIYCQVAYEVVELH